MVRVTIWEDCVSAHTQTHTHEQILEVTPNKIAVVRPLTYYLTNHNLKR